MSEKKKTKKVRGLFAEFKKFISRGNVVDMAVGVVIGGAFSAIVTSVVNVLLSVCTWGVPGGLNGLITVLPAVNPSQAGIEGIGQFFNISQLPEMTIAFAASQGATITAGDASFIQWQEALLGKYKLYGTTYAFNGSAIINWGAIINAVISFLIIAIVLFIILKVINTVRAKAAEAAAKIKEKLPKKEEVEEEPKAE